MIITAPEIAPAVLAVMRAEVEILDAPQRSAEWHAARVRRYGASEAAAMLGLSPYMTRTELLRLKHLGMAKEHSDYVQEHVLDHGHAVEAAIRAHMEEVIGDDLSPVTCARRGTLLSASCDGLTLLRDEAWECKQWNEELAASVRAGVVPDSHMPQCQQILLVTGARRCIFTVSAGIPEHTVWCEVLPSVEWFERIVRGWEQFTADLAAYVPAAPTVQVVAAPVEALPAVSVRMDGVPAVTHNMDRFGHSLRAYVATIPAAPSTDQEFADCAQAVKVLERAEESIAEAVRQALASIEPVNAMQRAAETLRDIARSTRLRVDKLVAARKEQLREEAVRRGVDAVENHVTMLRGLHAGYLTFSRQAAGLEIAAAIKGLKSLDSIAAAVDARAATLKIQATAATDRIAANLKALAGAGDEAQALFADRASLVLKDPEAVAAIVAQRLAEQRAAEERRRAATPAQTAALAPQAAALSAPEVPALAPSTAEPIRLADICARLGWKLTAAEVSAMGVATVRQQSTVLIAGTDIPKLKAALRARVEAL